MDAKVIKTDKVEACFACGKSGTKFYGNLTDRLFGVSGEWFVYKCTDDICGCTWLNPMPTKTDIWKLYENYYTHTDSDKKNNWLYKLIDLLQKGYWSRKFGYKVDIPIWAIFLSFAVYLHPGRRSDWGYKVFYTKSKARGRMLEIGCGSGVSLKRMCELGWNAEGVDFDENAVKNASAKGLTVYLGDLASQNLPENSYDVIVMSHVIEHVLDPEALLAECYRILKPGGRLVSITPNVKSFLHFICKKNWMPLDPPRHLHLFSKSALAAMAKTVKFDVLQCVSVPRGARGVYMASRILLNKNSLALFKEPPPTLWVRLISEAIEIVECALLWVNKNAGEELVLVVRK